MPSKSQTTERLKDLYHHRLSSSLGTGCWSLGGMNLWSNPVQSALTSSRFPYSTAKLHQPDFCSYLVKASCFRAHTDCAVWKTLTLIFNLSEYLRKFAQLNFDNSHFLKCKLILNFLATFCCSQQLSQLWYLGQLASKSRINTRTLML